MKKNLVRIFTLILCLISIFVCGCSSNNENTEDKKVTTEQKQETQQETSKEDREKADKKVKDDKTEKQKTSKEESNNKDEKSEIHFIDTGNSDSILIKKGNKAALIDGGDNDDDQKVVLYLRNQGVTELEYVFATHPDADHIGGLDSVINEIPVKNIYVSNGDANSKTYSDFIQAMANKGLGSSVPLLNSEFPLGDATFKVLSVANEKDVNNDSIVLLYTNGNDKILLMGDAGREIESNVDAGDVDLIKVGHHGSKTSTSPNFIDKVKPEYAVITCGKNNRFGHPDKETMDTLKSRNIKVYRSDECGDIIFTSSGNGLSVNCKEGDYKAGNSNQTSTNNSAEDTNDENTNSESEKEKIVYWTPNGDCYHSTKSCPSLSRSKIIYSGTIEESGKTNACERCN